MILMAVAAACPYVQAQSEASIPAPEQPQAAVMPAQSINAARRGGAATEGYITPSTSAGVSEVGPSAVYVDTPVDTQQAISAQAPAAVQDSINYRESARRQAQTQEALLLLEEGRNAYRDKKYAVSLEKYQEAWKKIPKAPATAKWQDFIVKSISDASIAVAIEYSRVGRYDDAEQLLLDVLVRDPNNKRARQELSLLRDPVRNNPALTPEHVKNVDEVNRLLTLAYGYYDLGDYDKAYAEFARVLRIDKYNMAARRGQEAVSKRKTKYYAGAHDAVRAKALEEVDATWDNLYSDSDAPADLAYGNNGGGTVISPDVLRNTEALNGLHIAAVNFEDTPMEDALDFLRAEARKQGVHLNFIFEKAQQSAAPVAAQASASSEDEDEDESEDEEEASSAGPVAVAAPVAPAVISSLKMSDLSAAELLRRMCSQANCDMRVEDSAVVVYQKGAASQRMSRRQWQVRSAFFQASGGDEEDSDDDDFTSDSGHKSAKIDPKAALINMGVNFPQGSSAKYSPATGMLTVYNTEDELDTVEEAVNTYRQNMPKMVKVSAKFVEIAQTNEEELSFDWVINPFSVNNAGNTYVGGTSGVNSSPLRTVSDFVTSGGQAFGNNYNGDGAWPVSRHVMGSNNVLKDGINTTTLGNGLVTGGNRSGSGAVTANTLDNLIKAGSAGESQTTSVAPGIMSLSGIFDSGSYQMIMRGLSQKKGVDVMSAPSLVISGDEPMEFAPAPDERMQAQDDEEGCAKIEVVRRFVYPISYEAPQIQSGGNNGNNGNNNNNGNWGGGGLPVAAPANPDDWAVEDVGIMMRFQIDPLKEGEGDIIHFKRFEIRVVEFEGFVNYGSPITAGIANETEIEHIVLTENRIDMPVFSRRYINSNPCVYDGHTIAIGGLIQDEVQKVEDKVPVIGDLPFIGRLFRSNVESHVRKNLMVFVTAEILDPLGKPIRHRDAGSTDASPAATPGLFPDDGLVNP